MKLVDRKSLSDIIIAWLGVVALIVGGLFAGYQYLDKVAAVRVKEALSYVEQFNKPPIYNMRFKIEKIWLEHSKKLNEVLQPSATNKQYHDFVLQLIKTQKIETEIMLLIQFFETLETCSTKRICDTKVVHSFFGGYARSFYHLHYPFIVQWRQDWNDPSFAKGIETFAKPSRQCAKGIHKRSKDEILNL